MANICSDEWPTFEVGWPAVDSFYAELIKKVKDVIVQSGEPGHPDQQSYILVWSDLIENPPP